MVIMEEECKGTARGKGAKLKKKKKKGKTTKTQKLVFWKPGVVMRK